MTNLPLPLPSASVVLTLDILAPEKTSLAHLSKCKENSISPKTSDIRLETQFEKGFKPTANLPTSFKFPL